jgi:hypothetical protein
MKIIELRFSKKNQNKILGNGKFCTSRREAKGRVGDRFKIGNRFFEITRVEIIALGNVAGGLFKEEGYDSPEAFKEDWMHLHRQKYDPAKFNEDLGVYVHWFMPICTGCGLTVKVASIDGYCIGCTLRKAGDNVYVAGEMSELVKNQKMV